MLARLDVDAQAAFQRRLRGDRPDRRHERLRRGDVAEQVAQVRHRRRRRERERVDVAAADPIERVRIGRRGHGPVDRAARRPRSRAPTGRREARHARARPGRAAHARRRPPAVGTPPAATRPRTARAAGRCAARASARAAAVPGPIAAIRSPARARASSPAGASPRSKKAATPFADVKTSHAYRERSGTSNASGSIAMAGSSITSAPRLSRRWRQLARLLAGAGHDHGAAEQRPRLEPREVEAGDLAHDDRRRRPDTGVGDRGQRRPHGLLIGAGAVAHRRYRRLGRPAAGDEARRDVADAAGAHEDHERAARLGQCLPVDVGAPLRRVLVPGHDREMRRGRPGASPGCRRTPARRWRW